MKQLFNILESCQGVQQMAIHHPEGDVFVHSLQALRWAFRETIDIDLILAAMLHDVGKVENSKGHEKISVKMLEDYCSPKTLWLIENHMRVWYLIKGEMKRYAKVQELINHPWLPELVHLARWDKLGRNPNVTPKYDQQNIVDLLNKCVEKRFIV